MAQLLLPFRDREAPPPPPPEVEPAPILSLRRNGFDVWCDGYRRSGSEWSGTLAYLSLFGPQVAVRAWWAALVGDRSKRKSVALGDEHVSLDPEKKYFSMRSVTGKSLHLVMVHPDATSVVSPFSGRFFLVAEDPSGAWWGRFNRLCRVPFRASWREALWRAGLERELVRPLRGFGVPGHEVDADAKPWAEVVEALVASGELR